MKYLYLIRHGKSDWHTDHATDKERPLNSRGREDAHKIGDYLKRASVHPDRVLCSSAQRTLQTLGILTDAAGWRSEVNIEEALYLADPADVIRMIRSQPAGIDTLAIVGHQPFTGLVASLLLGNRHLEVPTACVIGIEFDATDWDGVINEQGRLLMHLLPRRLG